MMPMELMLNDGREGSSNDRPPTRRYHPEVRVRRRMEDGGGPAVGGRVTHLEAPQGLEY